MKTTNVSGTTPTVAVVSQVSNDGGSNWKARATLFGQVTITEGQVQFAYDLGTAAVAGSPMRLQIQMGRTGVKAYVELWLTGRDAH